MTDDTNVETFPQQQATKRKGKPTIAEILDGAASHEEGIALLAAAYPELTPAEAQKEIVKHIADLDEFAEQLERETASMKAVEELVKPVWKDNPGMTLEEELEWLASQELTDPFLRRLREKAVQQADAGRRFPPKR